MVLKKQHSKQQSLWSWNGVCSTLLALGVAFMLSMHSVIFAHPNVEYLVDLFFIASAGVFSFNLLRFKSPPKKHRTIQIIVFGIPLIVGFPFANHWINRPKINTPPSEIYLKPHTNKPFRLKLVNNEDAAIFDVNFNICVDNKILNPFSIQVIPVKCEDNPDTPIAIFRILFSNGCCGIFIHDINAHSMKDFDITVIGQNIDIESRVSFSVYAWLLNPSAITFSGTGTKNLRDLLEPLKPGERRDLSENFNLKVPGNPYFPGEKETKYLLYDFIACPH